MTSADDQHESTTADTSPAVGPEGPAGDVSAHDVTLVRVIRSEWIKLRSVRSTIVTLGLTACGADESGSTGAGSSLDVLVQANSIYPEQQRQWFSDVSAKFAAEIRGVGAESVLYGVWPPRAVGFDTSTSRQTYGTPSCSKNRRSSIATNARGTCGGSSPSDTS